MTRDEARQSCESGNEVRIITWPAELRVKKLNSTWFIKHNAGDTLIDFIFEDESPSSTWELYSE